jgi:hypothetical protein
VLGRTDGQVKIRGFRIELEISKLPLQIIVIYQKLSLWSEAISLSLFVFEIEIE